MKFRPLHDRVLARRVEQEAKTTGGVIIPDTAQEKPMEGDVIAVGPGTRGEDARFTRSMSRPAIVSSSASGKGAKSRSTARN